MKKENKALLLALVASLSFLCGCSKKTKTIETSDGTYVESNGEYVRVNTEPIEYEAGTHFIYYIHKFDIPIINTGYLEEGYNCFGNIFPETPEGYRLINITNLSDNDGYVDGFAFFYVNEVPVIVEGKFNSSTGEVEYLEPGEVVKSLTLENNN